MTASQPAPSNAGPHTTTSLPWLLIGVGVVLRIVWALIFPVEPVSDSHAYDVFARNIVEHGVYGWTPEQPGAYWPVGTSALAALTYLVVGDSYAGVVALNLLAAFFSMILVYRLGEIYFGVHAAFWSVAVMAFWPNLIMFTSILSSELFFIVFTLAGLWFWERRDDLPWSHLLLCGLAWAAACYIRPIILLVPLTLVIVALPGGLSSIVRTGLRAVGVTVIVLALVAPWSYRNHQVFGEFVLMSTNFGPNLWMGNNPESDGGYMRLPDDVRGLPETERARILGDLAKDYIREDPLGFVVRTLHKSVILHDRETIGVAWNQQAIDRILGTRGSVALKVVASGYWYLLLLGAFGGIAILMRRDPLRAIFNPPVALWAYVTALHAVIVVMDRYHMPSSPFIALLAGVTLATILAGRQTASRPAAPDSAAG